MSNDYTNLQLFGLILYHIFKTYLKLKKLSKVKKFVGEIVPTLLINLWIPCLYI